MKPNMIKKWSIALLVAAGAAGLTGCEGLRVEEGSSTSNHSGLVADRSITGKLSGVVVDEDGRALSGVTVSAYGMSTTSESNGTWTLNNVPITNLVINSVNDGAAGSNTDVPTDGDVDVNSPIVAQGKIYTSFSKSGYATFHSTYEGAIGVISHSGTQDDPNSIVVDSISATIPYVELSEMNRTFTGTVYDLGESNYAFQKAVNADVQMRLIPNYVTDNLYGFDGVATDLQTPVGGAANEVTSGEFSPGYYGVDPVTVGLDGDGKFTISGAGALRSGYELRVDGTGWRPAQYPEWNPGNQQTLIAVYDANNLAIADANNAVNGLAAGGDIDFGAYWKIEKLNIATGTNGIVTDFGNLYVQNFEADDGIAPRVATMSYFGGPDNLGDGGVGDRTFQDNYINVDSEVATGLGNTTPIVIVFDQDMRSISTMPSAAVRLYDDTLTLISASAVLDGRTLTITTTEDLEEGFYRVLLKRDVFVDKNGERLAGSNLTAHPNNPIAFQAVDQQFDSMYGINYGSSEYTMVSAVTDLDQGANDSLADLDPDIFVNTGSNTVEQTRIERLSDAVRVRLGLAAGTTDPDQAAVTFNAAAGDYRVVITDGIDSEIDMTTTTFADGAVTLDTVASQTGGNTATDAAFTVSDAGKVTVNVQSVQVGYTVAITPTGELTTTAGAAESIILADKFAPRVALQEASDSGQDAHVAVFNLETTDETGEVAYDGKNQLVYPVLNLTASLYDRSGYRGRSEDLANQTDANANSTTNELSDDLVTQSQATPLLATTVATTSTAGKTASTGRSDRFYNAADYDAWYQTSTAPTSTVACNYYYAEDQGALTGWIPVTYADGGAVTVDATRTTISDTTMTDWIDNAALATYVTGGTGTLGASTVTLIKAADPCDTSDPGSQTYYTARTIVIETTEDIADFSFDDAFKNTVGAELNGPAASTTNVNDGSALDTELTALSSAAGELHLLATLGDWRNVNESPRWTNSQGNVNADSNADGISADSLLQLVDTQDAAGNTVAVDHASGVVMADATPPLATSLSHNGGSIVVTFDQPLSTSPALDTAGNPQSEIVFTGDDGIQVVTYTLQITSSTAGTILRSTDYTDRFGNQQLNAAGAFAATLAFADSNKQLTITPTGAAANTVDFTDFFAALSHDNADSAAGTAAAPVPGVGDLSYYATYEYLQDANFNSWINQDTFDLYLASAGAGAASTPSIIGADGQGPRLLATTYAATTDAEGTFLLQDNSGTLSISAAHATATTDSDVVFTNNNDAVYLASGTDDAEVNRVWGYDSTTAANGRSTNSRLVIKFNTAVDISDALAFIYVPTNEEVSDTANIANVVRTTDALPATAGGTFSATARIAGEVAQVDSDGDGAFTDENNVVVELPDYEAALTVNIASTDKLVIQNIVVGGVHYSVHINAPEISNAASTSTETSGLTYIVYRHVHLGAANEVDGILVGTSFTTAAPSFSGQLQYHEEIDTASVSVAFSGNGAVDDDTTNFTGIGGTVTTTTTDEVVALSTTSASATNNTISYTLDALSAGSVAEGVNKVVGRNSTLTVTASDFSGNQTTAVITLMKGHGRVAVDLSGAGADENEKVLLNTISGDAVN